MLAEARRRAGSVPTALPLPPALPPDADTQGDRALSPELVRAWLLKRAEALKARELNLIHGPPPTLGAMHQRHKTAAAHWNGALPRNARLGWGALHTAVAAILYAALDAVFSPAGAVITVLAILIAINWL